MLEQGMSVRKEWKKQSYERTLTLIPHPTILFGEGEEVEELGIKLNMGSRER